MPRLRIIPFAIIVGLLLASCGEPAATPTPTQAPVPTPTPTMPLSPTPTAIDAADLFAGNCAVCHGADRQGVPELGPALTPQQLAGLSDAEVRDTILKGRPNTAMPAWKDTLSSEEIDALIQLIKYTPP